jgi:hypothetical protein
MVMQTRGGRNLLIGFILLLAAIQCVRSIYASSVTGYDWPAYAIGKAAMPYQGRVAMMPYLRWAENSYWMQRLSARYQVMSQAGNKMPEPMTVEKFASLLAALFSILILVAAAICYSIRCKYQPWWLMPCLVIVIATITLSVRGESNYWYVYDLPHAALFGLASICILEGWWLLLLLLFAIDTPVRETSIYLIAPSLAMWIGAQSRRERFSIFAVVSIMAAYWVAFRLWVHHLFAQNRNDTGPRFGENLHALVTPHHWPQLLSAGGYLVIFVWLERKRLPLRQRRFLQGALLCVPVTLYYGLWVETRIWLEWTFPLAILAASEWSQYSSTAAVQKSEWP